MLTNEWCIAQIMKYYVCDSQVRVYHVTIPGTFVEVELPGNAPLFKEGYVQRKNIMDGPHKKGWQCSMYMHLYTFMYCVSVYL